MLSSAGNFIYEILFPLVSILQDDEVALSVGFQINLNFDFA